MIDNTFYSDFSIAEVCGKAAIADTYHRAFKEWKSDYRYLTALVYALNQKIWYWYGYDGEKCSKEEAKARAKLYHDFWKRTDLYALDTLCGSELTYYCRELD